MSFLPALSGYWRAPTGPNARLHVASAGRNNDRRRLTFILSRELVEMAGWQAGERIVVSLGADDDLGAFQLSRCTKPRTGIKLIAHSNARGFRLHITLPPEIHGLRPAEMLDSMALPAPLTFTVNGAAMVLRADLTASAARAAEPFPLHLN